MNLDLVIRGGTVVTPCEQIRCDVGVRDGRIAALADQLDADNVIDAGGLLVMPGGVDLHCHIEQPEADGSVHEETFVTASASAFAGGTTTTISFVPQFKGEPLAPRLADYRARAAHSMMDYSFHQIISDPTDAVIKDEIPRLIEQGVRSLKVFLTYDPLHLTDREFLRVLAAARRHGALVTVHCENNDAIGWRTEALLAAGMTQPKYHAWSRPAVVEREATYRAIALAELVDQPIQVFHVSCPEVADEIAQARRRGLKVWGETCPQYLMLQATDMDRSGFEGAKFMCSPSPRTPDDSAGLWERIQMGVLDVVSSDHCGYSFAGDHGKRLRGEGPFPVVPNGIPGLATRLPILFSEGVTKGRISASDFVRLTSFNPARLFGLHPRKGTIAPGADADLVLWDPAKRMTITNDLMNHAIDYTPYEGIAVVGWPVITIARGRVVMRNGRIDAKPGQGQFLARGPYDMIRPRGVLPDQFDAAQYA